MKKDVKERIKERLEGNSFMNHNFMVLDFLEPDHAIFKLEIREESRNTFGMVHGGALYSLADNATGSFTYFCINRGRIEEKAGK